MLSGKQVPTGQDGLASKTSEVLHIHQCTAFLCDSPGPVKEAVSCSFASFANSLHAGDFLPAQLWQLQITPPRTKPAYLD